MAAYPELHSFFRYDDSKEVFISILRSNIWTLSIITSWVGFMMIDTLLSVIIEYPFIYMCVVALRKSIQSAWANAPRSVMRENFQFDQLADDVALTLNIYDFVDEQNVITHPAAIKWVVGSPMSVIALLYFLMLHVVRFALFLALSECWLKCKMQGLFIEATVSTMKLYITWNQLSIQIYSYIHRWHASYI